MEDTQVGTHDLWTLKAHRLLQILTVPLGEEPTISQEFLLGICHGPHCSIVETQKLATLCPTEVSRSQAPMGIPHLCAWLDEACLNREVGCTLKITFPASK